MGKKTQEARRQVRAEIRNIVARQRQTVPAFPTAERRHMVSDETAALDAEFEKRAAAKAKAEAASMVSRLSARFAPKRG